jgi:hypothetical protein
MTPRQLTNDAVARWVVLSTQYSVLSTLLLLAAVPTRATDPTEADANRAQIARWKNDPEHLARLRQNLAAFRALSPERQEQLRRLDRALHAEDPSTQVRLWNVLERYALWLNRLPAADREAVASAPNADDRLQRVRAVVEREWFAGLPEAYREQFRKADESKRPGLLDQWKREERAWYQERQEAHRLIEEGVPLLRAQIGQLLDVREQVRVFADESLRPLLNEAEDRRLTGSFQSSWVRYFKTVSELADKYQPSLRLPGTNPPPGFARTPRRWPDLPPEVREKLGARALPNLPPPAQERLRSAEGKWPEFPETVAEMARRRGVTLPLQLGPSRPEEFKPSLKEFLTKTLPAKLTAAEQARLKAAEGKWPDYPQTVVKLAAGHDLTVPGTTLPGSPEQWNKVRKGLRP